jgi:hypothetical protein
VFNDDLTKDLRELRLPSTELPESKVRWKQKRLQTAMSDLDTKMKGRLVSRSQVKEPKRRKTWKSHEEKQMNSRAGQNQGKSAWRRQNRKLRHFKLT